MIVAEEIYSLTPLERDIWWLCCHIGLSQRVAGSLLGVTQPSVCSQVQKVIARINSMSRFPHVEDEEVKDVLKGIGASSEMIDATVLYFRLNQQTAVADAMGRTQGGVRHVLTKVMRRLENSLASTDEGKTVSPYLSNCDGAKTLPLYRIYSALHLRLVEKVKILPNRRLDHSHSIKTVSLDEKVSFSGGPVPGGEIRIEEGDLEGLPMRVMGRILDGDMWALYCQVPLHSMDLRIIAPLYPCE